MGQPAGGRKGDAGVQRAAEPGQVVMISLALLLLLVAPAAAQATQMVPADTSSSELRIPRLLHRSFMAGEAALRAAARDPRSDFKAHWLASCTTHNPGWREVVWDEAAVLALVQSDFPWFLDAYLSYPKLVQRSDVTRYMVLYKHGGLYLDADVECYAGVEPSLAGKDLVLNCEYPGTHGQLHNAAMASAPGHPFWLAVLREAVARAPAAAARRGALVNGLSSLWQLTPLHNKVNAVLRSTGPMLLTSVYQDYVGAGEATCGRSVAAGGLVLHAYELGAWFTPCLFSDARCQRKWLTQHFLLMREQQGQAQAQQQHAVVGIHHYSGSWTGWDRSAKDSQQEAISREASSNALRFFRDSPAFLAYACSSRLPSGLRIGSSSAVPGTNGDSSGGSSRGGSSGRGSSSSGSSVVPGPMPLCMEFLVDSLGTGSCAMLSVLAPSAAAAAAAAGVRAGRRGVRAARGGAQQQQLLQPDVATEQLLQQLGCHVTTVTPDKEPPQGLRALLGLHQPAVISSSGLDSSSSSSIWDSSSSSSSSSSMGGGIVDHLQGLLRPEPEYSAEPPALSLQSLLHLDPRQRAAGSGGWPGGSGSVDDSSDSSAGQGEPPAEQAARSLPAAVAGGGVVGAAAAAAGEAPGADAAARPPPAPSPGRTAARPPLKYVLRLSCDGCELDVLRHLAASPGEQAAVLGRVELLLLDLPPALARGPPAAAGPAGLGQVYDLLYQTHGFEGFLRQPLPGGALRLGWVRRPGRLLGQR